MGDRVGRGAVMAAAALLLAACSSPGPAPVSASGSPSSSTNDCSDFALDGTPAVHLGTQSVTAIAAARGHGSVTAITGDPDNYISSAINGDVSVDQLMTTPKSGRVVIDYPATPVRIAPAQVASAVAPVYGDALFVSSNPAVGNVPVMVSGPTVVLFTVVPTTVELHAFCHGTRVLATAELFSGPTVAPYPCPASQTVTRHRYGNTSPVTAYCHVARGR